MIGENESGLCGKNEEGGEEASVWRILQGLKVLRRQLLQHCIKMKFSDGLLHCLMALPDGSHQRDQAQRCVCSSVYVLVYFCLCVFLWLHICIKKKVISKKALYWKHSPLAAHPPPSCLFISLN